MTEHLRDAQLWQQHYKVPTANMFVERIAKGLSAAKQCLHVAQQQQFELEEHVLLSSVSM